MNTSMYPLSDKHSFSSNNTTVCTVSISTSTQIHYYCLASLPQLGVHFLPKWEVLVRYSWGLGHYNNVKFKAMLKTNFELIPLPRGYNRPHFAFPFSMGFYRKWNALIQWAYMIIRIRPGSFCKHTLHFLYTWQCKSTVQKTRPPEFW